MASKSQDKKGTTNINEAARRELSITRDDYALCQYIHYRQGYPDSKKPGWCSDEKNEIADFIGISRPGLYKMIDRLERLGLLTTDPVTGYIICTVKFIDTEVRCKQSLRDGKSKRVNKVYTERKQSLHDDVNKVTGKELGNSKNISKNKLEDIVADAPNPEPETLKENKKTKKDTPAPRPAKVDYSEQVAEIVAHLNLKAKSRFRPDTSGTVKNISGRLKQGYTVDDFKTVIDFKCSQWLHDPKMAEYLRPETLFCEKHFEGYLNAANIWVNNGRPAATSPAQQRNQSVKQTQEDLARTVMANRKYYPPIEF